MPDKLFQQVPLSIIRQYWRLRKWEIVNRERPTLKDLVREDIERTCMVFTISHLEMDNVELQKENELLAAANQALAATIAYYESRS